MAEATHRLVEEEVVEQLRPRRQRPGLADTSSDISSSSDENIANVMNDGYKSEEEVDKNDISENSVYFDKNEGKWKCHHCIWTYKIGHPWIDHVHQKSFSHGCRETTIQWSLSGNNLKAEAADIPKLVNAIINNQNGGNVKDEILSGLSTSTLMRSEGENISKRENVRIDLVEESDEEVIELEFERAVEKAHTHTPYCPNCSSRITKVILRRTKRDTRRRDDLFGCLKCFSIFIPSENCLNPFRIFGSKGKQESIEIVEDKFTSGANLPVSAGGSTNAEGSSTIKQGDVFDLFWIFRKGREDSQGIDQVKHEEESENEEERLKKPGRHPHPSLPSGDVKIDIRDETDGTSDEVTAPAKPESEIKEEQSDKPQRQRPEPDEGRLGITTTDQRGEIDTNDGEPEAIFSGVHDSKSLEILKCIVYGGLIESITSLSVVSSAAASDASTLSIIAIGLATVFSGLIVFGLNLMDLNNDVSGGNSKQHTDKYQELLGTRGHFLLHSSLAILAYLVFGLIPPITYGFTFRESDNKDYKILAVAAASFACIFLLAIAKAYARRSDKLFDYVKTIVYYVTMAISVSGVSYAAGDLIGVVMKKLGWFEPTQAVNSVFVPKMISAAPAWASY